MKVVKETERKYYKYNYEDWTQPIATSNTTVITGGNMVITCSNEYGNGYYAWKAMDGATDIPDYATNTTSGWWQVKFPYVLSITNINFRGRATTSVSIYTDSSKTTLLASGNLSGDIAINNIKTDTIYVVFSGSQTVGINEITFTAKKYLGIIEGTAEDYDFYEDTTTYKLPSEVTERKYYKYNYEEWMQPIATGSTTSLTDGDMVITSSSTYGSYYDYLAFDGNISSTFWATNDIATGWWQIKFPYKIKITGLTFYNKYSGSSARTKNGRFYTSSNKDTPIGDTFTAPNSNYGSVAIDGIPSDGVVTDTIYFDLTSSYSSASGMGELVITATKQNIVEGTAEDYDFYTEKLQYKAIFC